MKIKLIISALCLGLLLLAGCTKEVEKSLTFNSEKDIIALHYDHAPDKDDGHSAVADRVLLQIIYGLEWIPEHIIAVSGTYGKNANHFVVESDSVMDVVWNDCGGWLSAHSAYQETIDIITKRWIQVLQNGGDVWVKEGGQSDITAIVVQQIHVRLPKIDTNKRIHVVQHSEWNEKQTADSALTFTKVHTNYIMIPDANSYLNQKGGAGEFIESANQHPIFGKMWKAAFLYLDPQERLDFSDTGELMYILGLGEINIDGFRERYLITK